MGTASAKGRAAKKRATVESFIALESLVRKKIERNKERRVRRERERADDRGKMDSLKGEVKGGEDKKEREDTPLPHFIPPAHLCREITRIKEVTIRSRKRVKRERVGRHGQAGARNARESGFPGRHKMSKGTREIQLAGNQQGRVKRLAVMSRAG